MDQAAQALSNIFGGALDEIREELNELKQSKTALPKRSEALEAAHNHSARVITQLQGALRETRSLAQAALASHKSDNLLNQQLWERLKEVRETVESQRIANSHLSVSLAEARNEVAAVKLLLDAMGSDQSNSLETMDVEEPTTRKDSAVDTAAEDYDIVHQNDVEQENDIEDPKTNTQQTSAFSVPNLNPPQFTREASVESSMTFCDAEQSAARRKQRAMGLPDRAIRFPPELQAPMPRPEEAAPEEETPQKRRKTMTSKARSTPDSKSSDHTFLVPALPLRSGTIQAKKSSMLESIGQLPGVALAPNDHATNTEDVDMEDNIVVAPRHARTAFALSEDTPLPTVSASPTMPQFGRIADEVLRDFEVDSLKQIVQPSRFSNSANESTAAAEQESQQLMEHESGGPHADDDSTLGDPDVVDPDSVLQHQPKNRGENDQTGVRGERRYQTIEIMENVYTVDRSRAHANIIQDWKSWSVRKHGGWIQWKSYASLDWTNQNEVEKMNKWRDQSLTRAGFPRKRKEERVDYTADEKDWLFERVKAAGGNRPNISMLDLTRQFNKRFGNTREEMGIQSVFDRLRVEYGRYNGQQKPTRGRGRPLESSQAKSSFSRGEVLNPTEDDIEQRSTPSHASDLLPTSITRTALLSQFQARTGEMQKSREQSQESSESKHNEQR